MFSEMRENLRKAFASSKPTPDTAQEIENNAPTPSVPEVDISVKTKLSKGQKKKLAARRKRERDTMEISQSEGADSQYAAITKKELKPLTKKQQDFGASLDLPFHPNDDISTRLEKSIKSAMERKLIDPETMCFQETFVRIQIHESDIVIRALNKSAKAKNEIRLKSIEHLFDRKEFEENWNAGFAKLLKIVSNRRHAVYKSDLKYQVTKDPKGQILFLSVLF